ncbi:MAG: pitrilysin family protein [Bacteroidales bacterium]|nr:pitrilysin family protein [Bacteroidales bacterium]
MSKSLKSLLLTALVLTMAACSTQQEKVDLNYEQYTLDNGLKVVLHQDKSDPIVAVAIQYHVGSGREKPGRTGFAHFFEHMLFQRSENLPRNAFFTKIAKLGGEFNGSTNSDGTNYYEVVPRDALEKVLWMESDRMGFFINTVTQGGLEREIDIVSNEKRQNYDSQPYGHSSTIMAGQMYPAGHPYSWTTIGEIADLRAATVDDVKEFYNTYYVPNNATLVLTGDFDPAQAKELIQKYFGEIPKGEDVPKPVVQPLQFEASKRMVFEDQYAKLPQLSLSYPTVEQYNEDAYPLYYFTSLFANGKKAPLYKVVVEEKKLAPSVGAYNMTREIAGQAQIQIRAFNNINLNDVYAAVEEAFVRFEQDGVDEMELEKLKVNQEASIYNRMSGILGKAMMMARDTEFGGRPDATFEDLKKYQAVTKEDIMRVYEKYFKGRPYFALSMVPTGKVDLALAESIPATVAVENVADQTMKSQTGKLIDDPYERTPSAFDRSIEPDFLSNTPTITVPPVWTADLPNAIKAYGIQHQELPLFQASVNMKGGMLLDPAGKEGLASITAQLMNEGTALKSPEELESALGLLGARVRFYSGTERMGISISGLSKNYEKVIAIAEEMLLQPRFDSAAFDRLKNEIKTTIRQMSANPRAIASETAGKLLYGEDGTLSKMAYGTAASIDQITLDDVKAFYEANYSPSIASITVAGAPDQKRALKALTSLAEKWNSKDVVIPEPVGGIAAKRGTIYFVDYPNAPQSMIIVAKTAMPYNHPDYYPAVIANYKLGSGSQGMLFDVLRLQKGYTYGAYSNFMAGEHQNLFMAQSSVQGSVTMDAVKTFKDLIGGYSDMINEEMLASVKNSLLKSKTSSFETIGDILGMLNDIANYNMPFDYVKQQENTINNITVDELKQIIAKHMNIDDMIYVVVGDAKSQMKPLEKLGLGKPVLVQR